jgi:hypothetical protein
VKQISIKVMRALANAAKDNQLAQNGALSPWFGPSFSPQPLSPTSRKHCYLQSNEIFWNLGIKYWNSRWNPRGSKIFTIQCTQQKQWMKQHWLLEGDQEKKQTVWNSD